VSYAHNSIISNLPILLLWLDWAVIAC
jgi:hypothetical protein